MQSRAALPFPQFFKLLLNHKPRHGRSCSTDLRALSHSPPVSDTYRQSSVLRHCYWRGWWPWATRTFHHLFLILIFYTAASSDVKQAPKPSLNHSPAYATSQPSYTPDPVVYHYTNPVTCEYVASLLPPNHPEMVCLQAGKHVPQTRYGILGVSPCSVYLFLCCIDLFTHIQVSWQPYFGFLWGLVCAY
jgi:hypothetical protein